MKLSEKIQRAIDMEYPPDAATRDEWLADARKLEKAQPLAAITGVVGQVAWDLENKSVDHLRSTSDYGIKKWLKERATQLRAALEQVEPRQEQCAECNGTGIFDRIEHDVIPCMVCDGSGEIEPPPEPEGGELLPCPLCNMGPTVDNRGLIVCASLDCVFASYRLHRPAWQSLPRRSAEVAEAAREMRTDAKRYTAADSWFEPFVNQWSARFESLAHAAPAGDEVAKVDLYPKWPNGTPVEQGEFDRLLQHAADKLAGSAPSEAEELDQVLRAVAPDIHTVRLSAREAQRLAGEFAGSAPAEPPKLLWPHVHESVLQWSAREACKLHGSPDTFNSACFSNAWQKATGMKRPLDGGIVCAMLIGRDWLERSDVPGGAHWTIKPEDQAEPSPDAKVNVNAMRQACETAPGEVATYQRLAEKQARETADVAQCLRAEPSPDAGELADEIEKTAQLLRQNGCNADYLRALDGIAVRARCLRPGQAKAPPKEADGCLLHPCGAESAPSCYVCTDKLTQAELDQLRAGLDYDDYLAVRAELKTEKERSAARYKALVDVQRELDAERQAHEETRKQVAGVYHTKTLSDDAGQRLLLELDAVRARADRRLLAVVHRLADVLTSDDDHGFGCTCNDCMPF